jgi:hypothetical protein
MLGQRYKGIMEDEGPDISRGRGQMEFEEEEHGVKHLSPLVDLRNLLLEVSTCRLVLYAHCVIPTSLTFPTYSAIVASLYHRSSNLSQQGSCVRHIARAPLTPGSQLGAPPIAGREHGDMTVVAKVGCSARSVKMIMSLCFAKPFVIWDGQLRATGHAVACIDSVGRSLCRE